MKFVIPVIALLMIIAGLLYYYVFTGVIVVSSSRPSAAVVQIDGIESGITPFKKRVRSGDYQIKVYKEGFETWEGNAKVTGLSPITVSVKLRFLLQSDPTGASVVINGKEAGITDLALDLDTGNYTFELKKPGYRKAKFKANIPQHVSQSLPFVQLESAKKKLPDEQLAFEEKPSVPEYGSIQIASVPDAQVYIDGDLRGETPLTIKRFPAGSYVLKLSKEGYRDLRQTIYIKKGETTKVSAELKPNS